MRARNGEVMQEDGGTLEVGHEGEERARGRRRGAGEPRRRREGTKRDQRGQRALKNKMTRLDLKLARDKQPFHGPGETRPQLQKQDPQASSFCRGYDSEKLKLGSGLHETHRPQPPFRTDR